MPKKTKVRVKDLAPKSGAKAIKGGRRDIVGPCDRK